MVKVRDELPKQKDGTLDLELWVQRICANRTDDEKAALFDAANLALTSGGHHLTPVCESCIRQGLLTAEVLNSLEPDLPTLVASILYFPAHYGDLSLETIKERFGEDVFQLTQGVINITSRSHKASKENILQPDKLRRMLLAVVEDVRVVLIKLAERITAMRAAVLVEKHQRIVLAQETRDIYAPLANRLGIGQMKWELEDFAFRYLEPDAYKNIASLLDEKRLDREIYLEQVIQTLNDSLKKENIHGTVFGRVKHIFSIWRKMCRKSIDFKDVYDVRAVRILVDKIQDCYAALGIVHSLWQHVPKEFDDYIATPKENGYRSLHTAVIGPEGRTLEIQIRTHQMDQEAELGVAAHWIYKEGTKLDSNYQKKINAFRKIIDLADGGTTDEVNETLKQEIEEDRIYVFSPKGDVIDLPNGSTALDFAYHIHTELGHRCRGAKINGRIVPLNQPINSGEQVDILAAKEGHPSRDWLNPELGYLKSARARGKIYAWFKKQAREQNTTQGKHLLEKELKRAGFEINNIQDALSKFGLKTVEDLFAKIAIGDLRTGQVINALQILEPEEEVQPKISESKHQHQKSDITIQGVGSLLCHFAKCCKPVPGDSIVGYITMGRGVTIHRQDCINVLSDTQSEQERLIEVSWGHAAKNVYPVDLCIKAYDRQGLLKDITSILSNEKVNVQALSTVTNPKDNYAILTVTLEIADLGNLVSLLNKIMQLPNVIEATRVVQHSKHK
jgi:GTP pyrophosphokinase